MVKLEKNMSLEAFNNGYFYAAELKAFALQLGIKVGVLKKNELEAHIKAVLSGEPAKSLPKSITNRRDNSIKDVLALDVEVVNYVDDKATKLFLLHEVARLYQWTQIKSGQWYWLNAWRKSKIGENKKITYLDLVKHLHSLMSAVGRLPQIPSTRMNNFITDFLDDSLNNCKTRTDAMAQWMLLKNLNIPKTYEAYRLYLQSTI